MKPHQCVPICPVFPVGILGCWCEEQDYGLWLSPSWETSGPGETICISSNQWGWPSTGAEALCSGYATRLWLRGITAIGESTMVQYDTILARYENYWDISTFPNQAIDINHPWEVVYILTSKTQQHISLHQENSFFDWKHIEKAWATCDYQALSSCIKIFNMFSVKKWAFLMLHVLVYAFCIISSQNSFLDQLIPAHTLHLIFRTTRWSWLVRAEYYSTTYYMLTRWANVWQPLSDSWCLVTALASSSQVCMPILTVFC